MENPYYVDPRVQLVGVGERRILVRHQFGAGLIPGLELDDLVRLLTDTDGLTLSQAIEQSPFEADDVRAVIARCSGTVLTHQPIPLPTKPGKLPQTQSQAPIRILGNGALATALVQADNQTGFIDATLFAAPHTHDPAGYHDFMPTAPIMAIDGQALLEALAGCQLLICALEGVSWRVWKQVQAAALAAGTPFLPVRLEPDGVRLGPTNIPGRSSCLDCGLTAQMRFLASSATPALDSCRTLFGSSLPRAPLHIYVKELEQIRNGQTPQLMDRIAHFGVRNSDLPIIWDKHCPTCKPYGPETKLNSQAFEMGEKTAWARVNSFQQQPIHKASDPLRSIEHVGILGGGTAGYLTALALTKKFPRLQITLIQSSRVPVIGVGEATTPLMPQFLHCDLGLNIHDLFQKVQPTFKLGIRFLWGRAGDGCFNYPFGALRIAEARAYDGHILDSSIQSMAMNMGKLPMDGKGNSLLGAECAYHLENLHFVSWLRAKIEDTEIDHVDATIVSAEKSNDQHIKALVDSDGNRHVFDLYVDCSGFRSLLLEETLESPFVDFGHSLFTDRAVIASVPHNGVIQPHTLAQTMKAGWCWNTPQRNEDHRGYVFSSAFLDEDQAVAEMKAANPGMGDPKIIRFRAGRHQHFWKGNVFALGNAYGFVEPLESTALHMLIRQIGLLLGLFPMDAGELGLQEMVNRKVAGWWDYLCWFLAIHYKYNHRIDSRFWKACRADVDVSAHQELLDAFAERGPLSADSVLDGLFDYPDPLWGPEGIDTILAGQQVPGATPALQTSEGAWRRHLAQCRHLLDNALSQAEALELMEQKPELLNNLQQAFKRRGPAFIR